MGFARRAAADGHRDGLVAVARDTFHSSSPRHGRPVSAGLQVKDWEAFAPSLSQASDMPLSLQQRKLYAFLNILCHKTLWC